MLIINQHHAEHKHTGNMQTCPKNKQERWCQQRYRLCLEGIVILAQPNPTGIPSGCWPRLSGCLVSLSGVRGTYFWPKTAVKWSNGAHLIDLNKKTPWNLPAHGCTSPHPTADLQSPVRPSFCAGRPVCTDWTVVRWAWVGHSPTTRTVLLLQQNRFSYVTLGAESARR